VHSYWQRRLPVASPNELHHPSLEDLNHDSSKLRSREPIKESRQRWGVDRNRCGKGDLVRGEIGSGGGGGGVAGRVRPGNMGDADHACARHGLVIGARNTVASAEWMNPEAKQGRKASPRGRKNSRSQLGPAGGRRPA